MKNHRPRDERIPLTIQEMKPFLAMEIMEKAQELEAAGRHVIHLEIGEPDLETPPCIREACIRALRDRRSQYTHSLGLLELREEILQKLIDRTAQVFKKNPEELNEDVSYPDDLKAKSVQMVQIITVMEDIYDVQINYMKLRRHKTIGEVADFIAELC